LANWAEQSVVGELDVLSEQFPHVDLAESVVATAPTDLWARDGPPGVDDLTLVTDMEVKFWCHTVYSKMVDK
jgi:hypothetical protein